MSFNKIELLAPAGSKEALDAAIGEGADAVYLGFKDFNARSRAKNFSYREIEAIIEKLHLISKKVYITLNTVFEERETDRIYNLLKYLTYLKPDAIIVQDFGIINMVNRYFKELKIHASTQMNISNHYGVNFLSKYNVKRVVLSRELSLDELKKIRENTNVELETFVHGALCISVSGLCLFSSYLKRRSANRGECIQPCRAIYNNGKEQKTFFSPRDLMLLEHVPSLIEVGINSIKIEGRMKSSFYVGAVVKAYRYLIDNYNLNKDDAMQKAKEMIIEDLAREKTTFLFLNKNNNNHLGDNNKSGIGIYLGNVKKVIFKEDKYIFTITKNSEILVGDLIRVQSNDGKRRETVKIELISSSENETVITTGKRVEKDDEVYLIKKIQSKRSYHKIIPKNLNKYKRHPGNTHAPEIKSEKIDKKKESRLTNGIYVALSNFNDIYNIQSFQFEKVILHLTEDTFISLTNQDKMKNINIKKNNIIIYLDPYLPEERVYEFSERVKLLAKNGFNYFILNNLSHISLLPESTIKIAGPYLYSFNSYAIDFLIKQGFSYIISPIENNKRNLFLSTKNFDKKNWLITTFSFPELFIIVSNIKEKIEFSKFFDQNNNSYDIIFAKDKSVVIPEKAFSITDKADLLKAHSFEKMIIDFANVDIKKGDIKRVMSSVFKKEKIPQTSRFNWKDGFYIRED